MLQKENLINLILPNIQRSQIIGIVSALRPYRKGFERYEREQLNKKTIYHNYGHGMWGVNLSYTSALQIIQQFEKENNIQDKVEIAIIGCGAIGLMTAYILKNKGYKITVYSKQMPIKIDQNAHIFDKNNKNQICELITSQVAPGFVYKAEANYIKQNSRFSKENLNISHQFFEKCLKENLFEGLTYKINYDISSPKFTVFGEGFDNVSGYTKVFFNNDTSKIYDAFYQKVILVDSRFFYGVYQHLVQQGVEFVQKEFLNLSELEQLKEKIIFNCTGLGSYHLFQDLNLYPNKGQLIYIKQDTSLDYSLFFQFNEEGDSIDLFPHNDKIVLGSILNQKGNWNNMPEEHLTNILISRYQNLFSSSSKIQPKL